MPAAGIRPAPAILLVSIAIGIAMSVTVAWTASAPETPKFKVDPFWPKELPNNWIMGQVGGMAVDRHDHIWVLSVPVWTRSMSWARHKFRRNRSAASPRRQCSYSMRRETCCSPGAVPARDSIGQRGSMGFTWTRTTTFGLAEPVLGIVTF